jgi:hypothetical protein
VSVTDVKINVIVISNVLQLVGKDLEEFVISVGHFKGFKTGNVFLIVNLILKIMIDNLDYVSVSLDLLEILLLNHVDQLAV